MPLTRIAVVNRGAAAVRLIQAIRERSLELGADIRSIAFVTESDLDARYAREADERYVIGPARVPDGGDGAALSAYLSLPLLQEALLRSRADAAWVGWGFIAENPDFAAMCQDLGITYVGAPADVLRSLRSTITAKRLAESAGLRVRCMVRRAGRERRDRAGGGGPPRLPGDDQVGRRLRGTRRPAGRRRRGARRGLHPRPRARRRAVRRSDGVPRVGRSLPPAGRGPGRGRRRRQRVGARRPRQHRAEPSPSTVRRGTVTGDLRGAGLRPA